MLRPDPAQQARLTEIRGNPTDRMAEAEREGWLGEVEGFKVSLLGPEDKPTQLARRARNGPVDLGPPSGPDTAARRLDGHANIGAANHHHAR